MTLFSQMQQLWEKTVEKFGSIDIWINNAGISNTQNTPWDLPADEIECVVKTNMLGEMFGTKTAITGFIKQGHGALYNMEGMGAQGNHRVKGLSIYGATKAGLRFFNDSISIEIENDRIQVGAIQPGMMLTEMVTDQYLNRREEWEKFKGIFCHHFRKAGNCCGLADRKDIEERQEICTVYIWGHAKDIKPINKE